MSANPKLFVVSGPSGAGKGTLLAKLRAERQDLGLTVSATTRSPRDGEKDGISYHFLSDAQFDAGIAADDFLEWANVHGHKYGTPKSEVNKCLAAGQSVILEIDVQGALIVKQRFPEAVLIFIEPPSLEVLEKRLRDRKTEDEASIMLRMANAAKELALAPQYDVRVVNDELDLAVKDLDAAIKQHEMM
ncbi:guanylate kinase [Atopobium fossor]|uniref:guanylate kinase n=1 Tax=Atopobium fossor TaxID=39487 RepID=UPI000484E24C|nr:guanylate kinase [Atopobium fossor]